MYLAYMCTAAALSFKRPVEIKTFNVMDSQSWIWIYVALWWISHRNFSAFESTPI